MRMLVLDNDIKSMQLYPRPERIYSDLEALGYGHDAPLSVEVLSQFDQLHYHGIEALDVAISACKIKARDRVLEVGSGWGGCARHIANATGATITAVELQADYDRVARKLTARTNLGGGVEHVNADFLQLEIETGTFDHAVSWLALFHIPRRSEYLDKLHRSLRPGGKLFVEDLYLIKDPDSDELEDFKQHLFPNSLVRRKSYFASLENAGFDVSVADDMTNDWLEFTFDRLKKFRDSREQYVSVHGVEGYEIIETFYTKMAGYFSRGLVGGLRIAANRRL
ncbi:SAM-dependent methyltransferase [Rhodobacterales bacterium HTCC2150]|nr:SAM-dependent methyltransferase [Rhodobacterales bacterium HTCC2150] [Rhodobacteraceae bacterium HTCC2150]